MKKIKCPQYQNKYKKFAKKKNDYVPTPSIMKQISISLSYVLMIIRKHLNIVNSPALINTVCIKQADQLYDLIFILFVIAGPIEKYWEVTAERLRKSLEKELEEGARLQATVFALEKENLSCKVLIENNTNLLDTLKVKNVY